MVVFGSPDHLFPQSPGSIKKGLKIPFLQNPVPMADTKGQKSGKMRQFVEKMGSVEKAKATLDTLQ